MPESNRFGFNKTLQNQRIAGFSPRGASMTEIVPSPYRHRAGYPGNVPLSPALYREYKAWDSILKRLRAKPPKLHWGVGHFGNHQAPLLRRKPISGVRLPSFLISRYTANSFS